MEKQKRQSNFELLRILAMLLIIGHHFSVHGGFTFSPTDLSLNSLWIQGLALGGKLGVNLFVLISGYFLCSQTHFRVYKACALHTQVVFYSLAVFVLSFLLGQPFSIRGFVFTLLPITNETWWFASCYFVLFLFSPFINILLQNLSKRQHQILLLLMGVLWCGIYTVLSRFVQNNNLLWFFALYVFAAYIRKYADFSYSPRKLYVLCGIMLLLVYLLHVGSGYLGTKISWFAGFAHRVYAMESVPMLALSVLVFLAFKNTNISYVPWVNRISATTFGIYLLHDHPYIRPLLWTDFLKNAQFSHRGMLIPYSLLCILGVFLACSAFEFCRSGFFRLWYDKAYCCLSNLIRNKILPFLQSHSLCK